MPEEELKQVETVGELIGYYKGVFTLLSSCAARQLDEVTFRRGAVSVQDLAAFAVKYFNRMMKKAGCRLELKVQAEQLSVTGDVVLLRFMLENLMNEALACRVDGLLELNIYRDGAFVRFDFIDRRRNYSQEELNLLFYPHLSRMGNGAEGKLEGTEYLVCKQIIRDHDEFSGRRGCRMNASRISDGGFMVWFTLPVR